MARLSSKKVEKKIISLLLVPPTHMRVLRIDPAMFASKQHRVIVGLIKKYVRQYKAAPTKAILLSYANQLATTQKKLDEYTDAFAVLEKLPKVRPSEAVYYFDRLENYSIGRSIFDIYSNVKDKFDTLEEVDFKNMRQKIISDMLRAGALEESDIKRGMVYENVEDRWKSYKETSKGVIGDTIPFGMAELDEAVGGMRKTFVTLLYSKSAGGKSRTAINAAYNAAQAGYNVMYFSLEMAFDLLANCFDSRMSEVDSKEIIFGKLNKADKKRFRKALIQQVKEQLNVWIVDISMGAKSQRILEEIELYVAAKGVRPDLVVIDYANIMEPDRKYGNRSEKYDYLFQEYHSIARFMDVAILTATQESREASKADIANGKKKDNAETEGIHNIGLSNFMAPHCETVIRLKQDSYDKMQNRLWMIVDKNRYGNAGRKISVFAKWDKTYVGDRTIASTVRRVQK